MQVRPLAIAGAYEVTPQQFPDERGVFLESFRADILAASTGHEMRVRQSNVSVSARGAIRGIHYADVPPSQAKYITAITGSFLDFVIDIRTGSPTFGQWDSVLLDTRDRRGVYLGEGLGHAICSLQDGSTVSYLCSEPYAPAREHGIDPLDPAVGLRLPDGLTPVLSTKDQGAPTLARAHEAGLLPTWEDCQRFYATLRRG